MKTPAALTLLLLLAACQPPEPSRTGSTPTPLPDDAGANSGDIDTPDSADHDDAAPAEDADPGGCQSDGACGPGSICQAEQCLPGCRFDDACGPGAICQDEQCQPGCRDPSDCPPDHTCRAAACAPIGCADDGECGGGHKCVDAGCVEIGAVPCDDDGQCGHRWRCAARGICFEGDCLDHEDCASGAWCRQGICLDRRGLLGDLHFRRTYPAHLSEHVTDEGGFYGIGGGLFDLDGDLDLDVFLGGSDPEAGSPPCVYRNVSEPGALAFEPLGALCGFDVGAAVAAGGVDVEGDGRDELVLLGPGRVTLERFHPERATTDLLEGLDPGDPRRTCYAGSYAATDLDLDGRVDLVIGCQDLKRPSRSTQTNLVFLQIDGGRFEPTDLPAYAPLASNGVTLAIGVLDIDNDGLLDVLILNDAFVENGSQDVNTLTTGVALFRAAPDAEQTFDPRDFGQGLRRGGSFMGGGNIEVDGAGEHLYLTDWGPNRLIHFRQGVPVSTATDLGIDLGFERNLALFAWSALVDDLDRNGLDDLLVTQGMVASSAPSDYMSHRDTALLQRAGGLFTRQTDEAGLGAPSTEDSRSRALPFASRGAAKADLDGDGYLDLLIAGLEGVVKIHSEQPTEDNAPDRCALAPAPRVAPGYGLGFAVAALVDGSPDQWRRHDIQGQMRMGSGPHVLTTLTRGLLRFPSGAQVAFDCNGAPGPLRVSEPDWLGVERQGDAALVRIDADWLPGGPAEVVAAVKNDLGAVRRVTAQPAQGRWRVPLRPDDAAILIRLDGRWVPRWLTW